MKLTENQLLQWRELKAQFDSDPTWTTKYQQLKAKRGIVRPEIVKLLASFVNGGTTTDELRSTWDMNTRTRWTGFGLKGLSSAMFLNMLVKHIPDQKQLLQELVRTVRVPNDEKEGRSCLAAFVAFLEREITSGHVTRRQIQPARVPFFVSAFWHLQSTEAWPMFYFSARQVFQRNRLYSTGGSLVEDYFAFRDTYLLLMSKLDASSWDVEQLCWFDIERNKPNDPAPDPEDRETEDDESDSDESAAPSAHAHAQWLLASIGKSLGCKIWIAANDHNKLWNGQRLGDLSIASLPALGIGSNATEKIVRLIDVLWLKGPNQVVAAFEVENSTSIYSGLLRMADLTVLSPNISFPLYIVAPKRRLDKVRDQLARPSLQALELHRRCGFFSIEALNENAEPIKRWAKDPDRIDDLAEYAEESDTDD